MRVARRLGLLVGVLLALVAAAPAPAADTGQSIALRTLDTSRLPQVRAVVALEQPTTAGPPAFTVEEDGQRVPQVEVQTPEAATAVALVIDTSQSMEGRPIRQALRAAGTFVDARRSEDRVGIYGFGSGATTAQAFTTDAGALALALGRMSVDGRQGTALYDGVLSAVEDLAADETAARRVAVVLTDGKDTASRSGLADVQRAARDAGIAVHTVAISSPDGAPGPIQELASATGGTFREASPAGLSAVYADIAAELARTYVLSWTSAASGRVDVEIAADGSATRTAYVGGIPPRVVGGDGVVPESVTRAWWSPLVLAGLVFALVAFGCTRVARPRPQRTVAKRLAPYTHARAVAPQPAGGAPGHTFSPARVVANATEKILGNLRVWKRVATLIERADLPLRTAELFYLMLGAGIVAAVPAALLRAPWIATLAVMLLGGLVPLAVVKLKARKRSRAFDTQLPDILVAMAASLKAGHSFNQAMETVIKEGAEPAAKEFGRVANEVRLGRSSDEALEEMSRRTGSRNFEFVVLSVNIQRQVGGSMAELLDGVADTVRQRQQFLRKVKALTAMGRMSAYTLVALPGIMALAITAINPSYILPLFNTPAGQTMLVVALVSVTIGALVLKKIVSFKV